MQTRPECKRFYKVCALKKDEELAKIAPAGSSYGATVNPPPASTYP